MARMSEKQTTIWGLENDVREEVRERVKELLSDRYPEDTLHEIADSNIPIYNADRVECLLSDLSLADADDPGGIEGVTNIFDILAWTIYERLIVAAYEEWESIKEDYAECSECGEWYEKTGGDWDDSEEMCLKCAEKIAADEDESNAD
jgi:hypothetical protein